MIYFITSNKNKFNEIQAILPVSIEQLVLDLPEIQELDSRAIIKAKLEAAFTHHDGPFIVEDTSLELDALNGLPGPFIKWFEQTVTNPGLATIAIQSGKTDVIARVSIGYAKDKESIEFFEGVLEGDIVAPRGENGFGWDVIFQPKGYDRTLAEMTAEEKNEISHRMQAVRKLAEAIK
jgi:inosine triphosphate pyrophosphatase